MTFLLVLLMTFLGLLKNAQNFGKHPPGAERVFSNMLNTLKLVPNCVCVCVSYRFPQLFLEPSHVFQKCPQI
jgi:hypothetical protein